MLFKNISIFKNFTKFTGKHLCPRPATLLKKGQSFFQKRRNLLKVKKNTPKEHHRRPSVISTVDFEQEIMIPFLMVLKPDVALQI